MWQNQVDSNKYWWIVWLGYYCYWKERDVGFEHLDNPNKGYYSQPFSYLIIISTGVW